MREAPACEAEAHDIRRSLLGPQDLAGLFKHGLLEPLDEFDLGAALTLPAFDQGLLPAQPLCERFRRRDAVQKDCRLRAAYDQRMSPDDAPHQRRPTAGAAPYDDERSRRGSMPRDRR